MEKIVLIGIGDTAKDVYYFVKDYNLFDVIAFAVDSEYIRHDYFCDLPVISIDELVSRSKYTEIGVFITFQWNYLNSQRRKMYERLKSLGIRFVNIISPYSVIHSEVEIGSNCWIADNVIVESNVRLGNNTFVKSRATIGHYSRIGSHCFIGIASVIGGKSIIGDQSFIGMNATVFDEVVVGEKCILGSCTVIKRNLEAYSLVKYSNNNCLQFQYSEDDIVYKLVASKSIR